ncbi:hypothetical protein O3M35_010382 [Rhynocoris fuscipes]|uniref:Alpha-carbonic anhydrase domain-containing protein n=1 Tax=Rhynocoris fuscipes TaxID=488301 RepID=A0AAW1CYP3_9HEMI
MYWGSVVSINNILWIISRKPLPISHFQLKLFRYIRNSNQEMIKYNFRPIKPLEGRMVFHVNPSPDNLDSLIISLNEVFNENVSEKRKSKEKRSDEVKNNQKVFLGYDLRTNDNKEESLSEDLQATDNEKPGIDASDIEDPHSLTNILNNVESNSEIEEKSLVVERNETPKENDSFLAMPDIKELKQANDDDYQHYLTKVEEYLRTAIEKVESKRLKAAKENEITPKKLSQTSVTNSSDSVRYHSETLSVPKKLVATNKKEMVDQSVVVDLLKDDNEEIDLTIKSTTDSKTSIKSETESREVVTATNTSYTKSVTSEKKGSERLTSEATDFYLKNKNDSKISDNESNEACFTAITTSYTTKSESEKKSSDHGRISSYIKSATLSEKEYIEKSPKGSLTSVPEYKSRENTPRQVLSSKRPKSAIKYTSAKTSEYSLAKRSKSKGSIKKKVNFSETVECNYYVLTAPSHNSLERRACSDHDINSTLMRRFSSEKSIDPSRNVPSKPNSRETVFNEIIEKSKTTTGKLLKQRKPQLRTTIVTQVFKDSRPTSSQTNSETRTSQSSRTSHSSRIIQNKSSVKSNITKRPAWKY